MVLLALLIIIALVAWHYRFMVFEIPALQQYFDSRMRTYMANLAEKIPGRFSGTWFANQDRISLQFDSDGVRIQGTNLPEYHDLFTAVSETWFSIDDEDFQKLNFRLKDAELIVERFDYRTRETNMVGIYRKETD